MMMDDDKDWSHIPLEDRCTHTVWKARINGYEELCKLIQKAENEDDYILNKYLSLIPKILCDNNIVAHEKGVKAVLNLFQKLTKASQVCSEIIHVVVSKCLGSSRARTKDLSVKLILVLVELEQNVLIQDELMKGMLLKNPKIVSSCLFMLRQILSKFGPTVLEMKTLLKQLPSNLEDRDKAVRDEGKSLLIEIYRWFGDDIQPKLSTFKTTLINELQTEFDKVKVESPAPTRFFKSDKNINVKKLNKGPAIVKQQVSELVALESVNVLNKIDSEFYRMMDSKKWLERKETLEKLEKLLDHPKLEKGDYSDLVRCITLTITMDPNVIVVGVAIKCVAKLALGLKKQFTSFATMLLPHLFDKMKEKKSNVIEALREATDAIFFVLPLESMKDTIVAALDNKSPSVKLETALYLGHCFSRSTPESLNKKLLKGFIPALVKILNESDPNVRDASAEALGTAMKVLGEKELMPYLTKVEPFKLNKIKEYSGKAVLKPVVFSRPGSARDNVSKVKATKPEVTNPTGKCAPVQLVPKQTSELQADVMDIKPSERVDITTLLTEQLLRDLEDKNAATRLEALNTLSSITRELTRIKPNLGELQSILIPRLNDSNAKISAMALDVSKQLAVAMGPPCRIHFKTFIKSFISAFSDNKPTVRIAAVSTLIAWGELAGYKDLFDGDIISDSLKSGSPVLKIELCSLLSRILPNLTTNSFPKEDLIAALPLIYLNLEDRNADVRKTAQSTLHGIMFHVSYNIMLRQLEHTRPSTKNTVTTILDRIRAELPATTDVKQDTKLKKDKSPVRSEPVKKKDSPKSLHKTPVKTPVKTKTDEKIDTSPLLPRNNMKQQRLVNEQRLKILKWNFITPDTEFVELLKEQMRTAKVNNTLIIFMFHHDFKNHLKALDLLNENDDYEGLISNLDLLLKWLTLRFFDTNPSVLLKCLEYTQNVFTLLSDYKYSLSDYEASSFVPYLVTKLGDPKDAVRDRVTAVINQLTGLYSTNKLFVLVLDGVKSKNSRQRSECLEELCLLVDQFGNRVYQPNINNLVKEIAKNISDRDSTVRNAAINVIVKIWQFEGDKIYKMVGNLHEKEMSLLEERIKRSQRLSVEPTTSKIEPEKNKITFVTNLLEQTKIHEKLESEQLSLKSFDLVEIDDSFLEEPIPIPECLSKKMPQVQPKQHIDSLTHLVHGLSSSNVNTAFQAGCKLRLVIESCEDSVINEFTNTILESIIIQLKFVNMYSFNEYGLIVPQTYRVLLRLIDDVFVKRPSMAQTSSVKNLQSLLQELIYASVENTTGKFVDGGYNKIIVIYLSRIIENSDFNKIACCCIKLLVNSSANPVAKCKTIEICAKCLIKCTHVFKTNFTTLEKDINVDMILYECHLFFGVLPYSLWKDRANNLPLKALKTFLLTFVKWKKNEIFSHMKLIENSATTDLCMYLRKLLRSIDGCSYKTSRTRLTPAMTEHLSQVFMKIASEVTAKEGLSQFLEFKKQHPNVDLSPYLAPTSQYFRDYVDNGLKEIEEELDTIDESTCSSTAQHSSDVLTNQSSPKASGEHLAQYYLDKLKLFHEKMGYPPPECPDFVQK